MAAEEEGYELTQSDSELKREWRRLTFGRKVLTMIAATTVDITVNYVRESDTAPIAKSTWSWVAHGGADSGLP